MKTVLLLWALSGAAFALSGVDLTVRLDPSSGRVVAATTNNTLKCVTLESSGDLVNWFWCGTYSAPVACTNFEFYYRTNEQRVFWRLRGCSSP